MYSSDDSDSERSDLCSRCQRLKLDDSFYSGEEVDNLGGSYPRAKSEKIEVSNYLRLRKDHGPGSGTGVGDFRTLDIAYQIKDEYPLLPSLRDRGCSFCSFFRNVLQSDEVSLSFYDAIPGTQRPPIQSFFRDYVDPVNVIIKLVYSWEPSEIMAEIKDITQAEI